MHADSEIWSIADGMPLGQTSQMFDWSDLLLLLPNRVLWVLFALFCLVVGGLVLWVKFG